MMNRQDFKGHQSDKGKEKYLDISENNNAC